MEVKWIKLWVDMFDNIKIRKLKKLPNAMGDTIEAIWFEILALAGKVNDNGYLFYIQRGQMIPYDTKRLSEDLDRNENQIEIALNYFLDNNMVGMIDNAYMIANWTTYQDNEALQRLKQKEIHTQYMQDYRAKQALISSDNNEQSTQEMPVEVQKKPIDEVSKKPSINTLNEEFNQLWALYPNKKGKENALKKYIVHRLNGSTFEEIKQGIENYNKEIQIKHTERQYIKNASTWFNQKCWEDTYDFTPNVIKSNKPVKPVTDWYEGYMKEVNEKKQEVKTDGRNIDDILKDFEERK
jgi:predicted phage replisome organizer